MRQFELSSVARHLDITYQRFKWPCFSKVTYKNLIVLVLKSYWNEKGVLNKCIVQQSLLDQWAGGSYFQPVRYRGYHRSAYVASVFW